MAFSLYVSYTPSSPEADESIVSALKVFASLQGPHPGVQTYIFYRPELGGPLEWFEVYLSTEVFWAHSAYDAFGAAYVKAFTSGNKASATTFGYGVTDATVKQVCDYIATTHPEPLPGSFWGRTTTESHGHDVLLRVVVPVAAVGVLTALLRAAAANPGVLTAIGTPSAHVSEHLTLLMHAVDSEALKSVLESSGQAALLKAPEISVKLVGGESATSEGVAGLASLGIVATVAEYVTGYVRHE
jgi:hypothetical protein